MPADLNPSQVLGSWFHSHEEDEPGRKIYRSAGFPFPPSRGRTGFTIEANGDVVINQPGMDDRTTTNPGTWSLDGNILTITSTTWSGSFEVVKTIEDSYVLRQR